MRSQWLVVVAAALLSGCGVKIGEITWESDGNSRPRVKSGKAVVLSIHTDDTNAKYRWSSQDGGAFDGPTKSDPKFTVPNVEQVRLQCLITINGKETIRTAVMNVETDAGQQGVTEDPSAKGAAVPPPAETGKGPEDLLRAQFVASGWMGDGAEGRKYITLNVNAGDELKQRQRVHKWEYRPGGTAGWMAIGYQFPGNNWGKLPGKNWSAKGFREIVVWARGLATDGKMPAVEFKAGGTTDPSLKYQDSFAVEFSKNPVTLTPAWTDYHIPLNGANLQNVVTGFVLAMSLAENPKGATVYIADITYR